MRRAKTALVVLFAAFLLAGCGFFDSESEASETGDVATTPGGDRGRSGRGPGGPGGFGRPSTRGTSIPVQVVAAGVRPIAQYLETNGTLQAESDVNLVARTSGPIVELLVEEGMKVQKGQLLARIDAAEIQAQLSISLVNLEEAELALDRARKSFEAGLVAQEILDLAQSRSDLAKAQVRSNQIQLGYTDIEAPFAGWIVERHIKQAEFVQNGTALFRLSDFDPLEVPIQVPERDLGRLAVGQPAYLTVDAFSGERFDARVLRVSPVVDAATGTVKVTLEVTTRGKLRPGMFASVFLETDRHARALVVPKSALVLESIGDTVYVIEGEVARRRRVELGFDEAEVVEVVAGLEEGDQVIVLGQDSLSDGTPVYVLDGATTRGALSGAGGRTADATSGASPGGPVSRGGPAGNRGRPGGFSNPSQMTPEMIAMIKARMKDRGVSDKDIEQRIEAMKRGEMPQRRPPGS